MQPIALTKTANDDNHLDVGEIWTYTYTYEPTQADMDAGKIVNTATATNTEHFPNGVKAVETVTGVQKPSAVIGMFADPAEVDGLKTVTYTYNIYNNGNVTLTDIVFTDTKLNKPVTLDPAEIEPGKIAKGTLTFTVTQEDLDAGLVVENTASMTAKQLDSEPMTTSTKISFVQKPAMTVTKTADKEQVEAVGDDITYTIEVKNTGNITLEDVTVTDSLKNLADADVTITKSTNADNNLDVDETWKYTYAYKATQDDMDAGEIVNTATATNADLPENDPENPPPSATKTVKGVQKPAATLELSASPKDDISAPSTVTYTYKVKNTGNTTLKNLWINDSLLGTVENLNPKVLAPGATATGTLTYTVTQEDLDAGLDITNTATVRAVEIPGGVAASEKISFAQNPSITVKKTADKTEFSEVGETIKYAVTVANTGNISLTGLSFKDSLKGISAPVKTESGTADNILQVGETWTYTYNYAVTQDDIDAGALKNTASVKTDRITTPETYTVELNAVQTPNATLEISANPNTEIDGLKVVSYNYTVKNTGNVTLKNIKLIDKKLGGEVVLDSYILKPGETATGKRTYTVTQADMDLGGDITNTAAMTALTASNQSFGEITQSVTISLKQSPEMSLNKYSDKDHYTTAGEYINYTVIVKNTGNITLKDLGLTDGLVDLSDVKPTESFSTDGELQVGESWTYKYSIKITQDDIENDRAITNTATASCPLIKDDLTDEKTVYASQEPEITVTKTSGANSFEKLGEEISYEIVVENSGNMTLRNVAVTDSLTNLSDAKREESVSADGILQVGEKWTYTYTYNITQDDLDAGFVKSSVKASDSKFSSALSEATHTLTGKRLPAMSITKIAGKSDFAWVGEEIDYEIVVTNTGNVTLEEITVSDSLVDLSDVKPAESIEADGKLQVGESRTYKYKYIVTEDDFEARKIANSATVKNPDIPDGVTANSELVFKEIYGMDLKKTADRTEFTGEGEQINYTLTLENTGNVTLEEITVSDSLVTLTEDMRKESKTADGKLEMGEIWTYNYTYTTTQADIEAGKLTNSAKAENANFPEDDPLNPPPTAEYSIKANSKPSVTVTKTADKNKFDAVGDVIVYTVTVKNTGNVRLRDVSITDSLIRLTDDMRTESKTADGILETGETWTYTYAYAIRPIDLLRGFVSNSVTVNVSECYE